MTFSGPLNASAICSTWTGTGTETLNNATITFTNGTTDTFAATAPGTTCSGGGNFGTVNSGSNYVGNNGTVTFTASTITWSPTADTLTFVMGNAGGTGTRNTRVTAGKPGYTASANVTDTSGLPVSTTAFTSGTTSGF